MDEVDRKSPGIDKFKTNRRKVVRLSQDDLVKMECLDPKKQFPLVIEPKAPGFNLADWAANNRELIEQKLLGGGRCFSAASISRGHFSLNSLPAPSPASYWIIVNERPLAVKSARAYTPRRNFPPINLFLCTIRCLTRTTGRLRSGFFARSRRGKAGALRLQMIEKSSA